MSNEILNNIDWGVLSKYIDDDLITVNKHPEYDLYLLNYTHHVKLQNKWDLYTRSCRGLVIDILGNIIARPFQKFKEIDGLDISKLETSKKFEIFEKLDGSLGITFYYEEEFKWITTTKGSFTSVQAIEADKMLNERYDKLDKSYTYLFEIIYPENRIIINYNNKSDMFLLSAIHTKIGIELSYDQINNDYSNSFSIVRKYIFKGLTDLYDLKKLEIENREGFVIRFYNDYRIKVKFKRYDILHRLMKFVSVPLIWKELKVNGNIDNILNKIPEDLLKNAPSEFNKLLDETVNGLNYQYREIENNVLKIYILLYNSDRKLFANNALKSRYSSILFKIYDNKCYEETIWKMIKPKLL